MEVDLSGIPVRLVADESAHSDKEALRKAINDGTIATLKSLSSPFSADPQEAFYDYAVSQSVIEYLTSCFDKDKINNLLIQLNNGNTMDDALMKVYGFDLDGLDKAWMNWLTNQSQKKNNVPAGAGVSFYTVPAFAGVTA